MLGFHLQAATEALQTETMEMGKAMYSQPGASGPDPSAAGGAPGGDAGSAGAGADNVVDAEFTESDDKK
jgi:molecular chaperone DnaK